MAAASVSAAAASAMKMKDREQTLPRANETALGRRTRIIVEDMGAAIVTGRYAPNEVLPIEADLGAKYQASRSVLREAVKILNAKGLVTARPRRGTSVTPPSQWNLFDPDVLRWILLRNFSLPLLVEFTHMRLGIEPLAAALAAEGAFPEQKQQIRHGFERMVDAHEGRDDPLAADIAFHLAILEASRNRFLRRMKPLVEAALHFSIRYTDNIARDEAAKIEVHRAVLDAIEASDAGAAREAVRVLLDEALVFMSRGFGEDDAQGLDESA